MQAILHGRPKRDTCWNMTTYHVTAVRLRRTSLAEAFLFSSLELDI
jgi:hypothetical protein